MKAGSLSAEDFCQDPGFRVPLGSLDRLPNPAEGYGSPWGSMSALSPPPLSPLVGGNVSGHLEAPVFAEPATGGFPPFHALSPHTHGQLHPGQRVIMCE